MPYILCNRKGISRNSTLSSNVAEYTYLIGITLIILIAVSGCLGIFESHPRKIDYVGVNFDINYEEVISINYTRVEIELSRLGWNVSQDPNVGIGKYWPYGLTARNYQATNYDVNRSPEIAVFIHAKEFDNGTRESSLSVSYYPANVAMDDEDELDATKKYIRDKTNEVATICNITLDWSEASWGISYGV